MCQQKIKQQSVMSQILMCSHPLALSHKSLVLWRVRNKELRKRMICSTLSRPNPYRSVPGCIDLRGEMNAQAKRGNLVLWQIKSSCSSLKPDALPLKQGYRLKKVLSLMLDSTGKTLIMASSSQRYQALRHARR